MVLIALLSWPELSWCYIPIAIGVAIHTLLHICVNVLHTHLLHTTHYSSIRRDESCTVTVIKRQLQYETLDRFITYTA